MRNLLSCVLPLFSRCVLLGKNAMTSLSIIITLPLFSFAIGYICRWLSSCLFSYHFSLPLPGSPLGATWSLTQTCTCEVLIFYHYDHHSFIHSCQYD